MAEQYPSTYDDFLRSKWIDAQPVGFAADPATLHPDLFDFQRALVQWALAKGRAAIWADCGLGKAIMALSWAQHIPGPVLMLAPLAVSHQLQREADKFGIEATLARSQQDVDGHITITNYEMLHHFDPRAFTGVVLDESSCLKAFDSKTRMLLVESFAHTPYRLCCTATPAPNDHMELGNHAEFLGVMTRAEMLAMFFIHDGGETQKWRLKGHAQTEFWRWMCSWAVMLRKPSDLGYSDEGFHLPPLTMHQHTVQAPPLAGETLFPIEAVTLQEQLGARRDSINVRVARAAEIVNATTAPFIVWCGLNKESEALAKAIPDAVEIQGSDSAERKERAIVDFLDGHIRVLVSKSEIFGFGLNLQCCAQMAFVGVSHSFEQFYQAIRRCWRFGQTRPVNVHIITADTEGAVVANIQRKEREATVMAEQMTA